MAFLTGAWGRSKPDGAPGGRRRRGGARADRKAVRNPRASFLDPTVLARIDNLQLLARTVVDGFLQGIHRSPHLGVSMDFAEHRPYMPGDDIRRIDWRLYARTDRFYIKQFEAETNADTAFLLDASASMAYGSEAHFAKQAGDAGPDPDAGAGSRASGGPGRGDGKAAVTKLDYARFLVASLAWFSAGQKDRVGLYAFDDDVIEHVRCSGAHLEKVLHAVARVRAEREGSWNRPLARVANTFARRGILVFVSDFYCDPEAISESLGYFRARGSDVIAFQLLHPDEIDFPFVQAANFQDLETRELLPIKPEKLADAYRSQVREHIEELGRLFRKHRVDHVLVNTSEPLDQALYAYLLLRQKLARRAR